MSVKLPVSFPSRKLPAQPSLEQLRKQAKELLKQYQAGLPETVAEVEHFERHPDRRAFALNDAQRVLARAYGFESWPKLKAFVDGVNVEALVEAVQAGDLSRVRSLLHARPELIGMDRSASNEHRALHYAVLRRDAGMVKLLMEAGADARKGIFPHRDATSAWTMARERGYDEIVRLIEEEEQHRRAELSCPNATISPLQEQINDAIRRGENRHAIQLLESDLSLIQACDRKGATPLHIAAEEMNQEILKWLLARRANPNKEDVAGWTALDRAALSADCQNDHARKFPEIARRLLEHGAKLTVRAAVALGDTPHVYDKVQANSGLLREIGRRGGLLTLAVKHGQLAIVQLLLDLGADVDERNLLEESEEPIVSWGLPLWCAALANQREIAELLLDRGADPNANVYASGWPLRNAWYHEDESLKKLLLARGAKPQPYMLAEAHDVAGAQHLLETDPSEWMANELTWSAADHGCPEIVRLALPHLTWPRDDPRWHWILMQPCRGAGADPAANEKHLACLRILLDSGIDPNITRYGQTVLHFTAAYSGPVSDADRARFAELLLNYGARLDLRDDLLRSTPLGWACRWGRERMAELLIARGAPVDEPDAEPWATPRAWAEKRHNMRLVSLLEKRSAG